MAERQRLDAPGNIPPNVTIVTRWRQVAVIMMLAVLPAVVFGAIIGIGIYSRLSETGFAFLMLGGMVLALACMVLFGTLGYKMTPKDAMRVENNALVGVRYGVIPFDSITRYHLDDGIKIYRKGRATLRLNATVDRHSYNEFRAAFALAISAWQSRHPDSGMTQSYFYGSRKAKIIGGLLVLGSVGVIIAALALDALGGLGGAFAGISMGIYLIASKRKNGA